MFTTIAYSQSVDLNAAFAAINAVADQHVRVVGPDIQVPTLNQIIAAAVHANNVTVPQARLVSPSLRVLSRPHVIPINVGATNPLPNSPHRVMDLRQSPMVLPSGEQLNIELLSDDGANARVQGGVVWLADGPIVPVAGRMFTVRATGATASVASTWVNEALTFDEDLPRGRYQLVGLKAISANMIAARAVFVGGLGWRPGALGNATVDGLNHEMFRYGGLGVFGEFEDIEPPTIDVLTAVADATQIFFLDLIQVRAGGA